MPEASTTNGNSDASKATTVGIDVGGERKGFHAVAISDGAYRNHLATKDVHELSDWCRETVRARVIAIDAPCKWSIDENSRPAERQLMQMGIPCFSTPTREIAACHPGNYYGWMFRGEELFRELADAFPLCQALPSPGEKFCFETFPHAITWHLRGGNADASQKRVQRRALLKRLGIDLTKLTQTDLIDAALCSVTAYHAAIGGKCVSFGDQETGLIIVPAKSGTMI